MIESSRLQIPPLYSSRVKSSIIYSLLRRKLNNARLSNKSEFDISDESEKVGNSRISYLHKEEKPLQARVDYCAWVSYYKLSIVHRVWLRSLLPFSIGMDSCHGSDLSPER